MVTVKLVECDYGGKMGSFDLKRFQEEVSLSVTIVPSFKNKKKNVIEIVRSKKGKERLDG